MLAGFGVLSVRATTNLKPKTPKPKTPNKSLKRGFFCVAFGIRFRSKKNISEAQRERPPCTTKTLFSITVALGSVGKFLLRSVSCYFQYGLFGLRFRVLVSFYFCYGFFA